MELFKSLKSLRIAIFSLVLIALVALLWRVRPILTPFFLAFFIAYLLSPVVGFLYQRGMSRGIAIAVTYLVLAVIVTALVVFVLPEMFRELNRFAQSLPRYAGDVQAFFDGLQANYKRVTLPAAVVKSIDANLVRAEEWLGLKLQSIIAWIISLVGVLPLLILSPILSVYILYDWERFKSGLKNAVPADWRGNAIHLGQEINLVIRRFLRGNLTVAALVGIMTGVGMKAIGMDYALLIGVICGLFDLIPYFGPVIGAVPALGLALLKSPGMVLWALAVIVIVQQLESNIIQPKIMGDSLGLHPLVIVFALLAGGDLFGFWGMLLAVPIAGVFRVVLSYIYLKLV
ncbi:MAG: AI-2E family transporter [Firmicutes bacterium]|nr:AI-2E family transporter [Bacillota bacterium]